MEEEIKDFNTGETGIFSITVYADKPGGKSDKPRLKLSDIKNDESCAPGSGCC